MIETTKIKLDLTKKYMEEKVAEANISESILQSMEFEENLKRLNDGVFKIGVVAPFSAGKSTFINSLLEFDLLSTSILVETAAITTVRYGTEPKVVINYRDGSIMEFPEKGQIFSSFELKNQLKRYTAVNRAEDDELVVENDISSVDVYWPIELCKNGVEIIDTPGLFAPYEAHSKITSSILASVNAVIFIIDPTTVGEVNFMRVIKEYVENAKRSTIDNSDRHIFFAVNKLDQYPEAEVEKAYNELHKVLEGIIDTPNIFKVSSYFGLVTAMYEKGYLNLDDIRRDETIKFRDPDGYAVSGRSIQESDIPFIKEVSQIHAVKDSLGMYFEEKNSYLIEDIFKKLQRALDVELRSINESLQVTKTQLKQGTDEFNGKIEELKDIFDSSIRKLKKDIKNTVEEMVEDSSDIQKKTLMNKMRKRFDEDAPMVAEDWLGEMQRVWRSDKRKLTRYNSEEVVNDFFVLTDAKVETTKQSSNQKNFELIQRELLKVVEECAEIFNNMERSFNKIYEEKLEIDATESSFFDLQEIIRELEIEIEKMFKGNSVEGIRKSVEEDIEFRRIMRTSTERIPGIRNWLKSWIGREERREVFDTDAFIEDVSREVRIGIEETHGELIQSLRKMGGKTYDEIPSLVENVIQKHLLDTRIKYYSQWKQQQLNKLEEQSRESKTGLQQQIENLDVRRLYLMGISAEVSEKYLEIQNLEVQRLEEVELV
jgi:GTPase SAR1 family protein